MKKIIALFLCVFLACFTLSSCNEKEAEGHSIVALNFPAYDFAKNIIGEKGTVSLLLPPGGESHTFEPTAKDIIKISECDIFIYTGGESDSWVEEILSSLDKKPKIIKMMDFVEICREDHHFTEHSAHNHSLHEVDEHIWTSLRFSEDIVSGISREICDLDHKNSVYYRANAKRYINELKKLDKDFTELFESSNGQSLVVADRFPFSHFAEDYGLNYHSAYHSCTEDSEPTPKIIARLIDTVKKENIKTVFHLEFSNKTVATAVCEDTGATMKELHSCHNVTKDELSSGVTYVDLMRRNYEVLKEAFSL